MRKAAGKLEVSKWIPADLFVSMDVDTAGRDWQYEEKKGRTMDCSARERIVMRQMTNHKVLNEAYDYEHQRVSFSRGMRVEMPGGATMLLISGTSAVDENGQSIHVGDVYKQTWRTLTNIKALLEAEGADWHDIVRTTCYLADMRNYEIFNEARNDFFDEEGLDPYPASTCIGALICRADLSVEIEAIAMLPPGR